MKIIRVSKWSGIERTREIDITQEQLDRWIGGEVIQKVVPHLSDSDREFIISGMTDEEWEDYNNAVRDFPE